MDQKQHNWRNTVLVASLIFGMFFGAGNLIFPVQLGQLAGGNWLLATAGFLVTGTLVPFLAMLAVSVTRSKGVFDIAKPVAPWFGTVFLVMLHLTIGPFFGTPRTAATAFSMGVAPLLPKGMQTVGMLIFSAVFFGLAYFLSTKEANVVAWIGKYLNPLFLVLLVGTLLLAVFLPMGNLHQQVGEAYQSNAFFQGFLDGYNTMDGIALLALAVTVVYAIKGLGYHEDAVPKVVAKSGLLAIAAEVVLYTGLVLLGTSSLGTFKAAANGGDAFAQIVAHYTGNFGTLFTGLVVTLAVFTTAMGLFASFAQDMHKTFPKVSYKNFLRAIAVGSFVTANAGLTNIITWAVPVLMLMYPLALSLITLSLLAKYFNRASVVYRAMMLFVAGPALLDALANSPLVTKVWAAGLVNEYHHIVPFASMGLGWVLPGAFGFVLGYGLYKFSPELQTGGVILHSADVE
ncbi:branched-chain amino acid transport system II carrier protein [Periweissella cryptocerci]|uniref:Branched-chain amino acid transport system carrier protein n=1 Tax=Periweissella cryptocerci TaxID=2506420 RepID=A0A4P6YVU5_9LACO|nr:branched-chain amino acid transport system II carrier protein [Periweissella cryptocerci]QBO36901.1 branched-chain amino acid transport system II carrier protein [Periweissella cryptocerci]